MGAGTRAYVGLAVASAVGTLFAVQGIAPALPALAADLGVSDAQLGLFTAAYMLPAAVFAVPLGFLADTVGRRRVFVTAALLYSLAGGAQAWAGDYGLLLVLRFLQGVGFGALMPLSLTLIGDVLRGAAQVRMQSRRQIAMSAGEFALPLVGGALATAGWELALGAQAALLPLALVGLFVLADARPAVAPGRRAYARELATAVRAPGLPGVLTAGFLRFVCKFALIAYLPLLLVDRGASLTQAGLVLSVAAGVAAAFNLVVVALLRRLPASVMLTAAVMVLGLALIGFALAPGWHVALAVAVAFGLGDGALSVVQNALVTEAAPDGVRAGLLGVSGMTRNAGKLTAPLAMAALILALPVPLAFALLGCATLALVPLLRPVRRLDPLLASGIVVSNIR